MKRLFSIVLTLGTLVALFSCSGKQQAEQARMDSIRVADSIRQAEEAIEKARLDSIRRDSILQAEKIAAAMPTPHMFGEDLRSSWGGTLKDVKILRKDLQERGYQKINSNNFVLNPDGEPSVKVKLDYQVIEGEYDEEEGMEVGGGMTYTITLTYSNQEDADKFYKQWKEATDSPWITAKKSGKVVTLFTYGD